MARRCTVCSHTEREPIDVHLARGEPATRIAALFRVSPDAISRHQTNHLRPATARAEAAVRAVAAQAHDVDILAELRRRLERADKLTDIAEGLVGRAAQQGDWKTAIAGIGAATRAQSEARACLELQARIAGRLDAAVDERINKLQEQIAQLVQRPWANRWSA